MLGAGVALAIAEHKERQEKLFKEQIKELVHEHIGELLPLMKKDS